jgi:dihydromethanopterin reductase (acceptor)
MNILWCVTGAGHFLPQSLAYVLKIGGKDKVTVAFSAAGYEVAQMYGLLEEIEESFHEIVLEESQGSSAPLVGRLAKKEYGKVIIAPCTANTVAKIVSGVADSLVTNIVAQAGKCKVPVYILPTDAKKKQKTTLPLSIDSKKCRQCRPCDAMDACPYNAFYITDRTRINLIKCIGCKKCIAACKYKAAEFGIVVGITCRHLDTANVRKLRKIKGIKVLDGSDLKKTK